MKTFFFCACLGLVPLPHGCAAARCASTLLLGAPAKESLLWGGRLDALCCRKQVYTQRYFTGGRSFSTSAKKNVTTFFFVPVSDLYPCRTVVRRYAVPRHFLRIGQNIHFFRGHGGVSVAKNGDVFTIGEFMI